MVAFQLSNELQMVLRKVKALVELRLGWLDYLLKENKSFLVDDETDLELKWRAENMPEQLALIVTIKKTLADDGQSRLAQLRQTFALSNREVDVLEIALSVALDPSLNQYLGSVQSNPEQRFLTEYAIAKLLGYDRAFRLLDDLPLLRWRILINGAAGWRIDPQILCRLLGQRQLAETLKSRSKLIEVKPPPDQWQVHEFAEQLRQTPVFDRVGCNEAEEKIAEEPSEPLLIAVVAESGRGKQNFAASVCAQLHMPLLCVDARHLSAQRFHETYLFAQRQAYLDACALVWKNLNPQMVAQLSLFDANFPLQFICLHQLEHAHAPEGFRFFLHRMPPLELQERLWFWRKAVDNFDCIDESTQQHLLQLSVSVADIMRIGRHTSAANLLSDSRKLSRQQQQSRLGSLAQPMECPFTRDDWVVGEHTESLFDDFIFEGKERDALWRLPELARLFPRGRGLIALLSGPAGTGKTMAAQIFAAELGKDLYRVDLSQLVSKYIGETAENIAKVIRQAEAANVVMLFDEADALFAKRTEVKDANDRYANMDSNFLLEAIENYAGIALLATNKKSNIDSAFIRRLRYVIEFPMPKHAQRLQLWTQLLNTMVTEESALKDSTILQVIAQQIVLSGAQIKYAILSSLFIAKRQKEALDIQHLMEGISRELNKEGRSLADSDMLALTSQIAKARKQEGIKNLLEAAAQ